ncbi:MAG: cobalamin-independent methionine synthase II family protein [Actinomycetia bacterium]|nr:cobalamin-independent methionine synthase II family protein [Actinomycetes bacterium]
MDRPTLPCCLVGSYSQPDWLIDRARLVERLPSRVRAQELWRIDGARGAEACDDATTVVIVEQERAGVDIVTDGEIRRESYSNRFANALAGIDFDNHGSAIDRTGAEVPVPRVAGPISRVRPVEVETVRFMQTVTDLPIKITLPGPFTMTQQAQNDHYANDADLALAYAAAVNDEVLDLFAAGADVVQLDEPYVQARPGAAAEYAVEAIDRALAGAPGRTALHVCFGYGKHVADKPTGYAFLGELDGCVADEISVEVAQPGLDLDVLRALPSKDIAVGVLDLRDQTVETPGLVAERIRAAVEVIGVERVVVSPDCGMKYLPREIAAGKLRAMVAGARLVRAEVT